MRTSLRIALLVAATALLLSGCAIPVAPRVTLGGVPIEPYVADTIRERSQGLQGFDGLAANEGMVFVYPDEAVRTFGIKGVGFPIDVVFIGVDGTVSGVESLSPGDARRVQSPGPSRYAVELPAGWAEANGVGVGSEFVYEVER